MGQNAFWFLPAAAGALFSLRALVHRHAPWRFAFTIVYAPAARPDSKKIPPGFQVGFVLQRVLVQDFLCRLFQAIHDGDAQALLRHGFDQNALCPSLVRQAKGGE